MAKLKRLIFILCSLCLIASCDSKTNETDNVGLNDQVSSNVTLSDATPNHHNLDKASEATLDNEISITYPFICTPNETYELFSGSKDIKENIFYQCTQQDNQHTLHQPYRLLDMPAELVTELTASLPDSLQLTVNYFWINEKNKTLRFDHLTQWQLTPTKPDSANPNSNKRPLFSAGIKTNATHEADSHILGDRRYLVVIARTPSEKMENITVERVIEKMTTGKPNVLGDGVQEQIQACSNGLVNMLPYECNEKKNCVYEQWVKGVKSIQAGVIDMMLDFDSSGSESISEIKTKVYDNLNTVWTFHKKPNHIMIIAPPDKTIARATGSVGTNESTYDAEWFFDQKVLMHEIGHNFGLDHAGYYASERLREKGFQLTDTAGYMSLASEEVNPALSVCYNAANHYKLGWYKDTTISLSTSHTAGTYTIFGIVDAKHVLPEQNQATILYLGESKSNEDHNKGRYFLEFNRATAFNKDTGHLKNQLYLLKLIPETHDTIGSVEQPTFDETITIEGFYGQGDLEIYLGDKSEINPYSVTVSIVNTGKSTQSAKEFYHHAATLPPSTISRETNFTETEAEAEAEWIFCSTEGNLCRPPYETLVRYGAKDTFNIKIMSSHAFLCNNQSFDDPLRGTPKICEYKSLAIEPTESKKPHLITPTDVTTSSYQIKKDVHHTHLNTLDGDLSNRWAAKGHGQFLQYTLAQPAQIQQIGIAFFRQKRNYRFKIDLINSQNHILVSKTFSSKSKKDLLEIVDKISYFKLPPNEHIKHIKITGLGNNINTWNSYHEVVFLGN